MQKEELFSDCLCFDMLMLMHLCNTFKKTKNCRWSWWSIHLRNIYFIKKKNRRKKKHCSVIVFALIFWWSIHVCNRLFKKNCRWSWWSIHLRNIYFIKKKNRLKKKHCSLIVFALIFRWSIHLCNTFKKKKIGDGQIGHDGQYTCVIFILLKKKSSQEEALFVDCLCFDILMVHTRV